MSTATADLSGLDSLDTGVDQQIDPDQQNDTSVKTTQDNGGDDSQDDQQSQPSDEQVDGRRGPANIRNSIKAASEALPEQAQAFKELGNAFFREQAYKQQFPTPQEAASAKQLIEGVGGVDGIANLQQRDQMYQAQDEFLREGNPEILDDFAKDFPEGFATLAPAYLERLGRINPEALSAAVVPYAMGMLENAGIGQFLESLAKETDPARLKQLAQQGAQWYAQQRNDVQQSRQAPQKNPAADRLAQQQTELEQQREQLFQEGVQGKVNAVVTPEIQKTVDQYAKQYKLNDTQKTHFQNTLQQRVINEMNADETYKKQLDLRKANKSRTHDSVGSYIASEFNRRLKDAAFSTAKDIYGAPRNGTTATGTGVVKAGTPKTAPNGGPLFVSQRPPDSQLDLSRPNADVLLIQGRSYTKDGRFVTWRK